jgi:hypothetical protein
MPGTKQILETIINDKREFRKTSKNNRNIFKDFKKIKKGIVKANYAAVI